MKNAEKQKDNVHELLREKKKNIHDKYMNEADQKANDFVSELNKKLDAQKIKNDTELAKSISILKQRYEEKASIWVDAIVENVLR